MKLKTKLILFTVVPVVVCALGLYLFFSSTISTQTAEKIKELRKTEETSVIKKLKANIDAAMSIIDKGRKQGKTKEELANIIKNISFSDGTGYIWIHSFDKNNIESPTMIMHPKKPSLNGKSLAGLVDFTRDSTSRVQKLFYHNALYPVNDPAVKDLKSTRLFVEMNTVCSKSPNKSGIVKYFWSKPGKSYDKNAGYQKLSYVALDQTWGWVLGTGEYIDTIDQTVAIRKEKEKAAAHTLLTALIIGLFSLVIILSLIATIVSIRITKPIIEMRKTADDLAMGGGDLTKRMNSTSKDEVGDLANAIDKMLENLRSMIKEVRGNSQEVYEFGKNFTTDAESLLNSSESVLQSSQTVNQSSEQSNELFTSVASQATELTQASITVASAIEEMGTTIKEISESASSASSIGSNADKAALKVSTAMEELTSVSDGIKKILEAIEDIAAQTKLLALNATIEAAAAGDAGKGFAVVANEVKELASQTSQATDQIREQIGKITTSTESASLDAKNNREIVSELNNISNTIAAAVEEQAITVNEISKNIAEVSQTTGQISENLEKASLEANKVRDISIELTTVADESSSNSSKIKTRSAELSDVSAKLTNLVNKFKV